jgi:putative transposase
VATNEAHLLAAVRYVALNPVRARLAARAQDWPWSSVGAHLKGADDGLVTVAPVLDRVERFADLIETQPDDPVSAAVRAAETTRWPLGSAALIANSERGLGRPIARRAPGRKPATKAVAQPALF